MVGQFISANSFTPSHIVKVTSCSTKNCRAIVLNCDRSSPWEVSLFADGVLRDRSRQLWAASVPLRNHQRRTSSCYIERQGLDVVVSHNAMFFFFSEANIDGITYAIESFPASRSARTQLFFSWQYRTSSWRPMTYLESFNTLT